MSDTQPHETPQNHPIRERSETSPCHREGTRHHCHSSGNENVQGAVNHCGPSLLSFAEFEIVQGPERPVHEVSPGSVVHFFILGLIGLAVFIVILAIGVFILIPLLIFIVWLKSNSFKGTHSYEIAQYPRQKDAKWKATGHMENDWSAAIARIKKLTYRINTHRGHGTGLIVYHDEGTMSLWQLLGMSLKASKKSRTSFLDEWS